MAWGVSCHHMIRMQIQFTDDQIRALRQVAAERAVSISAVVREAVQRELSVDDREARWQRALAAAGRFRSKEGDISEEHDRYLAEDFLA